MRASRTGLAFVGALLAMTPVALQSQPIYRCGNTYSQTPCTNGIVVRVDDERTPAQKAQTDAATAQAAQLAERMQRDRLASEHRSAHATNLPARGKPGQPSGATKAAARAADPEADSKPKARSTWKAQGKSKSKTNVKTSEPDHFVATARQQDKRKAVGVPSRD